MEVWAGLAVIKGASRAIRVVGIAGLVVAMATRMAATAVADGAATTATEEATTLYLQYSHGTESDAALRFPTAHRRGLHVL